MAYDAQGRWVNDSNVYFQVGAGATPQQKMQEYQRLRGTGATDQQIRGAADQFFGTQTDTDWNALTSGYQPGNAAGGANPYGYGTGPGQSGLGYYEQQTPVGSFAAAEATKMNPAYASTVTASNPWIGQNTNIASTGANPYLGRQSDRATAGQAQQVGPNAYAGSNPYLQGMIDSTTRDMSRTFTDTVMPQFDRLGQASGSFGNTGVEQNRGRSVDEFGKTLGSTIGNLRFQDYTTQQGLAENALNRQQGVNLFNAGEQGQTNRFNANQSSVDLGRDANIYSTESMFNTGQKNAGAMRDLDRNANLAQGLSTFNTGQLNQGAQYNATNAQNAGQNNAQWQNNANTTNATNANSMLRDVRQNAWNSGERALDRTDRRYEFDQRMDFDVAKTNQDFMRLGQVDQWNFLKDQFSLSKDAIAEADKVQNTPAEYLKMFSEIANITGRGGSMTKQEWDGNPALAAIGGFSVYEELKKQLPWLP